jgi:hypothetical protein
VKLFIWRSESAFQAENDLSLLAKQRPVLASAAKQSINDDLLPSAAIVLLTRIASSDKVRPPRNDSYLAANAKV